MAALKQLLQSSLPNGQRPMDSGQPCVSWACCCTASCVCPPFRWIDNGDGTRGFFNVKACVTQAGYGYNSRIAQPCAAGTYNRRDTYLPCTACPTGLTTAGVGVGVTLADCGMRAGYGFHNGAVTLCPVGGWLLQLALLPATATMQT